MQPLREECGDRMYPLPAFARIAHGIGMTPNEDVALHEGRSEAKGRRDFHEDLNDMVRLLQTFRYFRHGHIESKSFTVNGKVDALMIHVADVSRKQGNCTTKLPVSNGNDVIHTRHVATLHENLFVLELIGLRCEDANGELGQERRKGLDSDGHACYYGCLLSLPISVFNFLK